MEQTLQPGIHSPAQARTNGLFLPHLLPRTHLNPRRVSRDSAEAHGSLPLPSVNLGHEAILQVLTVGFESWPLWTACPESEGGDTWGAFGTVPSTDPSPSQQQCHCGLDPLWWGHPVITGSGAASLASTYQLLVATTGVTTMSLHTARCPLGKVARSSNIYLY